jgi:hypothetical protein
LEEKRLFDDIWNSLGTHEETKAQTYTYEVLLEVKLKRNIIPDCSGWFLPSQAGQLKVSDEMTVHQPEGHLTSRNGQVAT